MMSSPTSSISEFYAGKRILVTGATGFIGKLLIEKLLYSCSSNGCSEGRSIDKIYCLVRDKNGHSAAERLNEITSSKVFDKMRKKEAKFIDRLEPVNGNILEADFGISDKAKLDEILKSVDVVFHLAGTVKLDQDIKTSLLVNVVGLQKTINMCKKMPNLQAFVYVSSIYANSTGSYIEERIYPSKVEPQKILNLLEWMEDDWLDLATKKLIEDKPNTFTYTKWIAESLLEREASEMPVVILRPSNIGAAWKEPFPGWVEKSSGPCDLFIAAGRGYLRSVKSEGDAVLDLVPVDIVVNLLITSAWYTATNRINRIQIYHCSTGKLNPFRWGEMESFVTFYSKNTPFERAFRRPNLTLTSNSLVHDYWVFFSHLIPAYMTDFALALIGQKPRVVNVYKNIHKMLSSIEYLTDKEWKFSTENIIALRNSLLDTDSQTFNIDPRGIHWQTYIENYLIGAKKYLLDEQLHGVPAAKQHLKMLRNIRWCTNLIIAALLWRLLIAKTQPAKNLWFFVLSLAAKFVRYFRISSSLIRT